MSRCILESDEHDVVIGWDPPIGSFFLQVLEPGGDVPLIWEGNGPRTYALPDDLIKLAAKFTRPFDHALLCRELMKDQAAHLERNYEIHGDIFWGTPADSVGLNDTAQNTDRIEHNAYIDPEDGQPYDTKPASDWVTAAQSRRAELSRNFTPRTEIETEVLEEDTCQFCKNPLNPGASTCASCGAFKYSVEQRLRPGLILAGLLALLLVFALGISGLFILIIPIAIYAHAKKRNGYTDLMVDGAPSPHQSDTTLRWLIDRLRS